MVCFIQVSLDVEQGNAEHVSKTMEDYGALSVSVTAASGEDHYDVAEPGDPAWDYQRLSAIFDDTLGVNELSDQLDRITSGSATIEIGKLEDRDWERAWLENYRPINVGENLWVCPSWCEPPVPEDVNLVIDPGLAFGTGTHETTRLCLEYLTMSDLRGKTILDFGCGSGILAIAALMLGARQAVGVDIDPRALDAAMENAKVNRVDNRFQAMPVDQFLASREKNRADIVVANILADTLIEFSGILESLVETNGELLLSGVLDCQARSVIEAFDKGLHFSELEKGQWVLLAGRISHR